MVTALEWLLPCLDREERLAKLAPRHQDHSRVSPAPSLRLVAGRQRVSAAVAAISPAIANFFATTTREAPCLAVDLGLIVNAYHGLAAAFPGAVVHYAVKANPAPAIIRKLVPAGSAFDCASLAEIRLCLDHGTRPSAIGYGSTVKKERDIAAAYALGVRMFGFDSEAELEKLGRAAPGSTVYCRVVCDGEGADWPLSRKFGCSAAMAEALMVRARALALDAAGLSFHVGSQQTDPTRWLPALREVAMLFARLEARGLPLRLLNIGGGMPARHDKPVDDIATYGATVMAAIRRCFSGRDLDLVVEPGRGLVGDAGVIQAEVILVSRKDIGDADRWIYLDIGKFSGLAETMNEAIKYRILTLRDGEPTGRVVLAGPTCDSADVLYEVTDYQLPLSLVDGDRVWITGAGAYTSTYSSVGFNGFPPLECVCI